MLKTHRLILRRFTPDDAEDMYRNWASDPEVTKFLTWPCHSSPEATRTLLEQWDARYEDGGYFNWAIEDREIKQVIGSIAAVKLNEEIASVEIGYCLSRSCWGNGIMPEALGTLRRASKNNQGICDIAVRAALRSEWTIPVCTELA